MVLNRMVSKPPFGDSFTCLKKKGEGHQDHLTWLRHCIIFQTRNSWKMKLPFQLKRTADSNKKILKCKVCKMTFQSEESLERHKNKARHFTGSIYFGKQDS